MKILIVQPMLTSYRLSFFQSLFDFYGCRLCVYYSLGSMGLLTELYRPKWGHCLGNVSCLGGVFIQWGTGKIAIKRNDILVLSGNPRYLSNLMLLAKARLCGAKVVWWGHYMSASSKRWRKVLRFIPMTLSNCLLFYTDREIEKFKADFLAPSRLLPSFALNNAIDTSQIERLRHRYAPSERAQIILFIGRVTKKACLDVLFQALQIVKGDKPSLHIIGDGDQVGSLKELAAELSIDHAIVWHDAMVCENAISKIANRARIFVYPGSVGLSLIHAMAYGLPAILHDSEREQMPEFSAFSDGKTGLTFSYSDPTSLADKISKLIANDTLLREFSNNSTELLSSTFNGGDMKNRFVSMVNFLERG